MRTRIALFVAVILASVLLIVSYPAGAHGRAMCLDPDFVQGLTEDLTNVAQQLNLAHEILDVKKWELVEVRKKLSDNIYDLTIMRHKYEDAHTPNPPCDEIRQQAVLFTANINDLLIMLLAEVDNLDNPKKYVDFIADVQGPRLQKLSTEIEQALGELAGGEAGQYTSTPTRLVQVTPTKLPATKVPATKAPALPTNPPPTASGNGPTAKCVDGTYSYAATHKGACSGHKGVLQWYR